MLLLGYLDLSSTPIVFHTFYHVLVTPLPPPSRAAWPLPSPRHVSSTNVFLCCRPTASSSPSLRHPLLPLPRFVAASHRRKSRNPTRLSLSSVPPRPSSARALLATPLAQTLWSFSLTPPTTPLRCIVLPPHLLPGNFSCPTPPLSQPPLFAAIRLSSFAPPYLSYAGRPLLLSPCPPRPGLLPQQPGIPRCRGAGHLPPSSCIPLYPPSPC